MTSWNRTFAGEVYAFELDLPVMLQRPRYRVRLLTPLGWSVMAGAIVGIGGMLALFS